MDEEVAKLTAVFEGDIGPLDNAASQADASLQKIAGAAQSATDQVAASMLDMGSAAELSAGQISNQLGISAQAAEQLKETMAGLGVTINSESLNNAAALGITADAIKALQPEFEAVFSKQLEIIGSSASFANSLNDIGTASQSLGTDLETMASLAASAGDQMSAQFNNTADAAEILRESISGIGSDIEDEL